MSQDNFNVLQPEALTDECLIAKKYTVVANNKIA